MVCSLPVLNTSFNTFPKNIFQMIHLLFNHHLLSLFYCFIILKVQSISAETAPFTTQSRKYRGDTTGVLYIIAGVYD